MSNILFKKNIVHYYPKMKFFMILLFVTFSYSGEPFQEHANSRCNMDFLRIAHDQAEKCVSVCVDHPVILYIHCYALLFYIFELTNIVSANMPKTYLFLLNL